MDLEEFRRAVDGWCDKHNMPDCQRCGLRTVCTRFVAIVEELGDRVAAGIEKIVSYITREKGEKPMAEHTFEDYKAALEHAGPRLTEMILHRAEQEADISFEEFVELCRFAYQEDA